MMTAISKLAGRWVAYFAILFASFTGLLYVLSWASNTPEPWATTLIPVTFMASCFGAQFIWVISGHRLRLETGIKTSTLMLGVIYVLAGVIVGLIVSLHPSAHLRPSITAGLIIMVIPFIVHLMERGNTDKIKYNDVSKQFLEELYDHVRRYHNDVVMNRIRAATGDVSALESAFLDNIATAVMLVTRHGYSVENQLAMNVSIVRMNTIRSLVSHTGVSNADLIDVLALSVKAVYEGKLEEAKTHFERATTLTPSV